MPLKVFFIVLGAHDLTLDVLSDVLADFLKRFTKLLRIGLDAEASQRESRFPVSTLERFAVHYLFWVVNLVGKWGARLNLRGSSALVET